MARKTNDLDKSSKNEIDSKKIHTKLETKKIPASVKTIIKTAEKNIKKFQFFFEKKRNLKFYVEYN
mgnify:CR=1 FL=1